MHERKHAPGKRHTIYVTQCERVCVCVCTQIELVHVVGAKFEPGTSRSETSDECAIDIWRVKKLIRWHCECRQKTGRRNLYATFANGKIRGLKPYGGGGGYAVGVMASNAEEGRRRPGGRSFPNPATKTRQQQDSKRTQNQNQINVK